MTRLASAVLMPLSKIFSFTNVRSSKSKNSGVLRFPQADTLSTINPEDEAKLNGRDKSPRVLKTKKSSHAFLTCRYHAVERPSDPHQMKRTTDKQASPKIRFGPSLEMSTKRSLQIYDSAGCNSVYSSQVAYFF